MNTVMFNELPVGTLFRVVNKAKAKNPIPNTDIFVKVKTSKGKYKAFNITKNPFCFIGNTNWDYALIYPECKGWECEKVKDFYPTETQKTFTSAPPTGKRFNCVLGNSDWCMGDNAYLSLTDDQIELLEYLINEKSVFDEDVGLTVVDTDFKAF